jgi:phosphohistidine phosphatase
MKTLLLMRHGKSSWRETKHQDDDKLRPLTKKGEKDAHKMCELLEENNLFPQVILTSTACRARATANVFLDHCRGEIIFIALDDLYMAEPPAILEALNVIPDRAERAMVIGHNPGLECLLQFLTGAVESLPTASVAYLELPTDSWSDLSIGTIVEKWEKWKPKDA